MGSAKAALLSLLPDEQAQAVARHNTVSAVVQHKDIATTIDVLAPGVGPYAPGRYLSANRQACLSTFSSYKQR